VDINDIAYSLSKVCRFAGHCREFYSVIQHSLLVEEICKTSKLEALLHDALEAYITDMPRPVKWYIVGSKYSLLEHSVSLVVADALGITYPYPPEVKVADNISLAAEASVLIKNYDPEEWGLTEFMDEAAKYTCKIKDGSSNMKKTAKKFLARWSQLTVGG